MKYEWVANGKLVVSIRCLSVGGAKRGRTQHVSTCVRLAKLLCYAYHHGLVSSKIINKMHKKNKSY